MNNFLGMDYDILQEPLPTTIYENNSIPQKMLRRLGIDSLYEKSLRYLRKIHDNALDPTVDLYLNDKLHNSVTYLKNLRELPEYSGTAKQSNR